MSIDVMEQMRGAFRAEALDLLIELDSALLALEQEANDIAAVHRVFRAIHTIKGSGATAGFVHLARFAHKMEEAFDLAREGKLAVSPALIDCGLKACDVLRLIIANSAGEELVIGEVEATEAFVRFLPAPQEAAGTAGCKPPPVRLAQSTFEITFKPNLEMFYSGADPVTLLDDLRALGTARITAHAEGIPALSALQPEHCYLWWQILLITACSEAEIKEVFVFAEDDCSIRIHLRDEETGDPILVEKIAIPPSGGPAVDSREAAFLNTTSQCVEIISNCYRRMETEDSDRGPILETYLRAIKTFLAAAQYRKCAELEQPLLAQIALLEVAVNAGSALSANKSSELYHSYQTVVSVLASLSPVHVVEIAPEPSNTPEAAVAAAAPSTIRIDQEKLDRLMRIVGELLVARGVFPTLIEKLNGGADSFMVAKDLKVAGSNISRIADELQSSVMSIRMLPVKTVFQRFPRLVRDLARSLGKEVQLAIDGEGIELDKTIIEQIGDPLVHVIRNAVDHGLELPTERMANGKNAIGQLTLRARQEAGGVAIEVTDDGRGIDAGALKQKAVEKGLITHEAASEMSEDAAFQLIFLPGLTTAAKVTAVSGRGVGMDVVRSNVRNLQGTIGIRSKLGVGTTFLIKLPASLMISKGILLQAGAEEYILPLSNIRDMVKLPHVETHQYREHTLAEVRGTTYSIFSLAEMLGLTAVRTPELCVAIVEAGTVRYGLVVDKFLSEVEVLVKPLSGSLSQCKEFQGAAIMGDGRVVLVLNAMECQRLEQSACN